MKAVRLTIRGLVQGVGFRIWFADAAKTADVEGWVRNRRDGDVEAMVRGRDEEVDGLIRRCWDGPPGSRVAAVLVEDVQAGDEPPTKTGFRVLPTA